MTSLVKPNKTMSRTQTKKSHSWWWDSHVSPKNSRWLAENLEEMDQSVKRMLKLIEEDGDSFAKKAEMYYQKRPELIAHVEEFYRIYRSLAERYDHITGELRKNIPSDLQSQGSGISDVGSEPPSILPSSDQKLTHHRSGPRAAGFEFFLGIGGSSSDLCSKGDESSTLGSDSESDDSSVNNYSSQSASVDDQGLRMKVIDLEVELREVKEKLRIQQENVNGSLGETKAGNSETLLARIAGYEEALSIANTKILLAEEEICRLRNLRTDLEGTQKDVKTQGAGVDAEENEGAELEIDLSGEEEKIRVLEEGLTIIKEKCHDLEKEVASLQHKLESNTLTVQSLHDQLGSAKKDTSMWKVKLDKEKREVSKLQDRISRYKANLSERDQEIRTLRETISNANKSLSEENLHLQAEMSKLLKERTYLEDNLREWDLRCQSLEEELRRVTAGKAETETLLRAEIVELKVGIAERDDSMEELNISMDILRLKYNTLLTDTHDLNAKVASLSAQVNSKDDQIEQFCKHLNELHIEHAELIGGTERVHKLTDGLKSRVIELEEEVERQKEVILQGAEEKREAIRQLCFSLEHYRNVYHQICQAFAGQRRLQVI